MAVFCGIMGCEKRNIDVVTNVRQRFHNQGEPGMKRLTVLLLPMLLAALSMTAWAGEKPEADLTIVTGEHWVSASLEQKRAFLFGVGNVLEIEQAMAGDEYQAMRGRSIVPVLLDGLSGVPIADMVTQLDKFYADHPDQIGRPVIGVLYMELALPRLGS